MTQRIPSKRLIARRLGAVLAALLLLCLATSRPGKAATIMGSGITISCGGWVEVRKTPNRSPVEEWSLGYLTGIAMWTPVSPLDGLDQGAVMVWLDNFCQQHPLVPFRAALDEFVRQRAALAAQQAQQRPGQPAQGQAAPGQPAPQPQQRR